MYLTQPLFHAADGFIQFSNLLIHAQEFFFQRFHAFFLFRLIRFGAQQSGIQLRPPDLHLFQHRIKTAHLGLDGRAGIQFPDDRILSFLHPCVSFVDPGLNLRKLRSDRFPLLLGLFQPLIRLALLIGSGLPCFRP